MRILKKLANNFLNPRAISVLGPVQYARYVFRFLSNLPKIVRAGDLSPLDQAMGPSARRFRYRGVRFLFDCRFCDQHIQDGSFAFGGARELYIRNCYFKFQPATVFTTAKTVLDLGANRGAFSTLMATRADFVLSVEAMPEFVPVIHHNMRINGFTDYAVERCLVGAGGRLGQSDYPRTTMGELLRRHKVEGCDLVKLDIEGSEFALFQSCGWLQQVGAISMEIHPDHGDPKSLLDALRHYGFKTVLADQDLKRVTRSESASFVYSWKDA